MRDLKLSKKQQSISNTANDAVGEYKRLLQTVLESRPSGTRQKLAEALGKNRSFISQIANPVYKTPVPVGHLEIVFDVCHFSKTQRQEFLKLYRVAHPDRIPAASARTDIRTIHIRVPDLGSDKQNHQLESLLKNFSGGVVQLLKSNTELKKR